MTQWCRMKWGEGRWDHHISGKPVKYFQNNKLKINVIRAKEGKNLKKMSFFQELQLLNCLIDTKQNEI